MTPDDKFWNIRCWRFSIVSLERKVLSLATRKCCINSERNKLLRLLTVTMYSLCDNWSFVKLYVPFVRSLKIWNSNCRFGHSNLRSFLYYTVISLKSFRIFKLHSMVWIPWWRFPPIDRPLKSCNFVWFSNVWIKILKVSLSFSLGPSITHHFENFEIWVETTCFITWKLDFIIAKWNSHVIIVWFQLIL